MIRGIHAVATGCYFILAVIAALQQDWAWMVTAIGATCYAFSATLNPLTDKPQK